MTPKENWRSGDTTTTTSDRTHLWATKHPLKRVERLSNFRAPRTTRLPKTKPKKMRFAVTDALKEKAWPKFFVKSCRSAHIGTMRCQ
jgi:hypothetical protein